MKKKGFTLIELIAILVILAIVALIAIPLVINIIKKSKINSLKRSVDGYGRAVELAASEYLLDNGTKANSFDVLNVKYSGKGVSCDTKVVYQNNIYLSKCKVGNTYVTDSKSTDGYYHYGDITKYGDIYVKAVNKALKRYYNNYDTIPENINELELNLDNLDFNCEEYKFNGDLTTYFSKCSIAGNMLEDKNADDGYYHYGEFKYLPGDKVKYKNVDYYVIEKGSKKSETLHLLKAEPIKQTEIEEYIQNTELIDDIKIQPWYTYLNMRYYYSDTCNTNTRRENCITNYDSSAVKQIVDIWANAYIDLNDLSTDSDGYKVRILNYNDVINNLEFKTCVGDYISYACYETDNSFYSYNIWTSARIEDNEYNIGVLNSNRLYSDHVANTKNVSPVINIKVSSLDSEE